MPTAPFNSLYTPFGSPCRGQKRRSEPFYSMVGGPSELFSKTYPSFLTVKEGSTSHLGLLPSGEKRKPPYSVLKPLRYKVGGPSEVYASSGAAVFCAG